MSKAHASAGTGWNLKLHDGTDVLIRSISRDDAERELEFLEHLSPEFRNARFLGLIQDPSPEVARRLTDLDPTKAVGFIALVSHKGRDRQIGAAQFHVNARGDSCDSSLTVSGEWRKRGVGTLLMQRLIEAARARGIRHMRAYIQAPSGAGDQLAIRLGFQRRLDPHDPATVIYDLELH
ncbi:N-acetyltransferase family protein [Dokdonella sp.]|uniref:GNAT family N-acetyltransferase n=1 Tax=Dokdonella sp. TaxID=2291710 RepID=UPI0031CB4DDC|nr:GNAT family N-acetyltransferase [Dokdonella sp.]